MCISYIKYIAISLSLPFQLENKNKVKVAYLPPLPIRLRANPIHLLGTVSVVRQCLYLNLSRSASSEFSHVWSKRGCKKRENRVIMKERKVKS